MSAAPPSVGTVRPPALVWHGIAWHGMAPSISSPTCIHAQHSRLPRERKHQERVVRIHVRPAAEVGSSGSGAMRARQSRAAHAQAQRLATVMARMTSKHDPPGHPRLAAPAHLRKLHMPLMPGSSTSACSTTPMPLRTMRRLPSTPAPEHVTTCGHGDLELTRLELGTLAAEPCCGDMDAGKSATQLPHKQGNMQLGCKLRLHTCNPPGPAPAAPSPPHKSPRSALGWAGCPTPPQSCRAGRGRAACCAACMPGVRHGKQEVSTVPGRHVGRGRAAPQQQALCEQSARLAMNKGITAHGWAHDWATHPHACCRTGSIVSRQMPSPQTPLRCPGRRWWRRRGCGPAAPA